MIRDPRDVVASLQCMRWASRSVITNASTWVRCNVAAACSIGPQYLPVRYETLIAEPEQSVARICARVGEEYLPSMLEPARDAPRLSGKAITAERVGAWRRTLTPRQVSQIEWMVGDHMEAFGYAREAKTASPLATAGGLAYALFESFRRRLPQLPGICSHFLAPANLAREEFWLHPDSRRGR